jgi:tetratricopeptide (TPR) repeat protein
VINIVDKSAELTIHLFCPSYRICVSAEIGLNILLLLFNFLGWVCCCVSFGGVLIESKGEFDKFTGNYRTSTVDFYWDRAVFRETGATVHFGTKEECADIDKSFPCKECSQGGKALIGLQVLSFFGLIAVLFLHTLRILGRYQFRSYSLVPHSLTDASKSLRVELIITSINAFMSVLHHHFIHVCAVCGDNRCRFSLMQLCSLSQTPLSQYLDESNELTDIHVPELCLCLFCVLFRRFFLGVSIYGGMCFSETNNAAFNHSVDRSATGTGFAFLICCFFFLVINVIIGYWLYRKPSLNCCDWLRGYSPSFIRCDHGSITMNGAAFMDPAKYPCTRCRNPGANLMCAICRWQLCMPCFKVTAPPKFAPMQQRNTAMSSKPTTAVSNSQALRGTIQQEIEKPKTISTPIGTVHVPLLVAPPPPAAPPAPSRSKRARAGYGAAVRPNNGMIAKTTATSTIAPSAMIDDRWYALTMELGELAESLVWSYCGDLQTEDKLPAPFRLHTQPLLTYLSFVDNPDPSFQAISGAGVSGGSHTMRGNDQKFNLPSWYDDRWNDRFQDILHKINHANSQAEVDRAKFSLKVLLYKFEEFCKLVSEEIVMEFLEHKTSGWNIPPASFGGVAGGSKFYFHGVMFKFASDPCILHGESTHVHGNDCEFLYGGRRPRPDLAGKAASNELKSVDSVLTLSTDLKVPLCAVIHFLGFVLEASAIVPVGPSTDGHSSQVYGTADGGQTYHNHQSSEMHLLMCGLGAQLNLSAHSVRDKDGQEFVVPTVSDLEGHFSPTDSRLYAVDFGRLCPPQPPDQTLSQSHSSSYLYQQFRPELFSSSVNPPSYSLDSDLFCPMHGGDTMQLASGQERAQAAFNGLLQRSVVAVAERVESQFGSGSEITNLSELLHEHGVNMRLLAHVRIACRSQHIRRWLLEEIAVRSIKALFRALLHSHEHTKIRGHVSRVPVVLAVLFAAICTPLPAVPEGGDGDVTRRLWMSLREMIGVKFNGSANSVTDVDWDSLRDTFAWTSSSTNSQSQAHVSVLNRMLAACGFQSPTAHMHMSGLRQVQLLSLMQSVTISRKSASATSQQALSASVRSTILELLSKGSPPLVKVKSLHWKLAGSNALSKLLYRATCTSTEPLPLTLPSSSATALTSTMAHKQLIAYACILERRLAHVLTDANRITPLTLPDCCLLMAIHSVLAFHRLSTAGLTITSKQICMLLHQYGGLMMTSASATQQSSNPASVSGGAHWSLLALHAVMQFHVHSNDLNSALRVAKDMQSRLLPILDGNDSFRARIQLYVAELASALKDRDTSMSAIHSAEQFLRQLPAHKKNLALQQKLLQIQRVHANDKSNSKLIQDYDEQLETIRLKLLPMNERDIQLDQCLQNDDFIASLSHCLAVLEHIDSYHQRFPTDNGFRNLESDACYKMACIQSGLERSGVIPRDPSNRIKIEHFLQRSVDALKRNSSSGEPKHMCNALSRLGKLQNATDQHEKAIASFGEAVRVMKEYKPKHMSLSPDDKIEIIPVQLQYANALKDGEEFIKCEEQVREVLLMIEQVCEELPYQLENLHIHQLTSLLLLGSVLIQLKESESNPNRYKQGVAVYQKLLKLVDLKRSDEPKEITTFHTDNICEILCNYGVTLKLSPDGTDHNQATAIFQRLLAKQQAKDSDEPPSAQAQTYWHIVSSSAKVNQHNDVLKFAAQARAAPCWSDMEKEYQIDVGRLWAASQLALGQVDGAIRTMKQVHLDCRRAASSSTFHRYTAHAALVDIAVLLHKAGRTKEVSPQLHSAFANIDEELKPRIGAIFRDTVLTSKILQSDKDKEIMLQLGQEILQLPSLDTTILPPIDPQITALQKQQQALDDKEDWPGACKVMEQLLELYEAAVASSVGSATIKLSHDLVIHLLNGSRIYNNLDDTASSCRVLQRALHIVDNNSSAPLIVSDKNRLTILMRLALRTSDDNEAITLWGRSIPLIQQNVLVEGETAQVEFGLMLRFTRRFDSKKIQARDEMKEYESQFPLIAQEYIELAEFSVKRMISNHANMDSSFAQKLIIILSTLGEAYQDIGTLDRAREMFEHTIRIKYQLPIFNIDQILLKPLPTSFDPLLYFAIDKLCIISAKLGNINTKCEKLKEQMMNLGLEQLDPSKP